MQIVTTNEKWIYFRNPYKFGQSTNRDYPQEPHSKRGQIEKKVILTVFWITKVLYSSIYSNMIKQLILNTTLNY